MSASTAMPPSPLLGSRQRLWPTVVVSLAVHVAFIGLALWKRPPAVVDLNQKPIVARLVRLGEVRPKELLPRKVTAPPPAAAPAPTPAPPPPAPPAPPKVAEAPRPNAMPLPKAEPAKPPPTRPASTTTRATSGGLASVLDKIGKQEKVYGSADGDARGDADEGEAGDQYLALVTRALQDTYVLPSTISERERMHLRATVVLFIQPDGRITRWQFVERSSNGVFDAALEQAVRSARLPPPPPEWAERYRSQGLAVVYRPGPTS